MEEDTLVTTPPIEAKVEDGEQVEDETTKNTTDVTAAIDATHVEGDIYQYVANPTDIIDPSSTEQYYEGEDVGTLIGALTDEDRKLAAALVDVSYKNLQPPTTSVIATMVGSDGETTTSVIAATVEADGETYMIQATEDDELVQEEKENQEGKVEAETKPSEILVPAKNKPGTRIIFKSSEPVKTSPVSSRKILPHKKRISPPTTPAKNTKTYVSCSKCGDLFTSLGELNTHRLADHGLKAKAGPAKPMVKKVAPKPPPKVNIALTCQLCDEPFTDQMVFFEHLKSHYEPKLDVAKIEVSDDEDKGFIYREDEDVEPIVQAVYVTETQDDEEYPPLKDKNPFKAIFQCGECHRQFASQKWLENHMKNSHFKFPDDFSDAEEMMQLDDKTNVVIRSWSPLGTTLLSSEPGMAGYTTVLDSNMTSQQYEAFETISVQLDGNNMTGEDSKTISVTLVPIHENSTENQIIAASSNEDWKGTVVLLEDKDMDKQTNKRVKKQRGVKKEKKCLICEYCNREFKYRNTLVYHLRQHTGEKPHMCDSCGKGFFTTTALKVHSRIHEGIKPYPCDICGRAFRQCGDLKYHKISIHSDLKAFQCEFCGKEFARKYSMIIHRRIHTGERNYVCEFCNKAFRASSYLQNHRRIHTGEKPHFCPVCNKLFRVRSDMKRHLVTHNVDPNKYLTVSGNQTGAMVSRVKKEPKETKVYYEDMARPGRDGKRARAPPAIKQDASEFNSETSEDEEMEEVVQNEEEIPLQEEEEEDMAQRDTGTQGIHHMEEVYTSKGMYVWVDE